MLEVWGRRNASNVLPVMWAIGELDLPHVLSLLKTSYHTESLVFPPNAGYLLRHANDRLSPPRHSP